MHRFRIALLAAATLGTGLSALASAQPGDRGDQPRGERGPRADQGQPRPGGGQGERPQAQPQPPQVQAPPQPAPQAQAQAQARPDGRAFDRGNRGERAQGFGQPGQPGQADARGFAGRDDRRQGFDPRQGRDQRAADAGRPGYDPRRGDQRQGFAGNGYRGGDQRFDDRGRDDRRPDFRAGGAQGRIGGDWRNDRRYDWRNYRDQHRQTFHVGRYVPPRAYYRYGYRPFEIGLRLDPFFYASNYWIDDPYDYRLPPVWGSYRWVRYYDDVLLVDLSTGEVVDVIHQFFW